MAGDHHENGFGLTPEDLDAINDRFRRSSQAARKLNEPPKKKVIYDLLGDRDFDVPETAVESAPKRSTPVGGYSIFYGIQDPLKAHRAPYRYMDSPRNLQQLMEVEPTFVPAKGAKKDRKTGSPAMVKIPAVTIVPLVVDTEYQTPPNPKPENKDFRAALVGICKRIDRGGSLPMTVQVKSINDQADAAIYLHPIFKQAFPGASPAGIETSEEPIISYIASSIGANADIKWCDNVENTEYKKAAEDHILRLHLYAHFAIADYLKCWGDARISQYLEAASRSAKPKDDPLIQMGRRLRVEVPRGESPSALEWLAVPAIVTINGRQFALEIGLYDASAMVGQGGHSLAGLHKTAGVTMAHKEIYQKNHKEKMILQFINSCDRYGLSQNAYEELLGTDFDIDADPDVLPGVTNSEFIDYALGDVETYYKAIDSIAKLFEKVSEELELSAYHKDPRPTTGSTVHGIIEACIKHIIVTESGGSISNEFLECILHHAIGKSSSKAIVPVSNMTAMNSKVSGGRCIAVTGPAFMMRDAVASDIDFNGFYASSMGAQDYPLGPPTLTNREFERTALDNEYPTLREFFKTNSDELIPGLWQVWFSIESKDGKPIYLPKYGTTGEQITQDLFPSYKIPRKFTIAKHDEDFDYTNVDWLDSNDDYGYYLKEVTNAVLNHDLHQIIQHVYSPQLYNFILDNAVVKTAMFYRKSDRCETMDEYIDAIVRKVPGAWCDFKLGEKLVDKIAGKRKPYKAITKCFEVLRAKEIKIVADLSVLPADDLAFAKSTAKEHYGGDLQALIDDSTVGGKHPLDELYKLIGNTVYGVLVSRYFAASNPMIGNNITARCRAMIWLAEKGLGIAQSITDGGIFDMNRVVYLRTGRKSRLNERNLTSIHGLTKTELHGNDLCLRPLGGYDRIRWADDSNDTLILTLNGVETVKQGRDVLKWIDQTALEHLRTTFSPDIDILKPDSRFTFETKGVIKNVVFHGSGNYYISGGFHGGYAEGETSLVKMRSYAKETHATILLPFFTQLLANPSAVDRTQYWRPYYKHDILKPAEYNNLYVSRYAKTLFTPGDSIHTVRVFRELSLSGFRFMTARQKRLWVKEQDKLKDLRRGKKSIGQGIESLYVSGNNILDYARMIADIHDYIMADKTASGLINDRSIDQHPSLDEAVEMREDLEAEHLRKPSAMVITPVPAIVNEAEVQAIKDAEDAEKAEEARLERQRTDPYNLDNYTKEEIEAIHDEVWGPGARRRNDQNPPFYKDTYGNP